MKTDWISVWIGWPWLNTNDPRNSIVLGRTKWNPVKLGQLQFRCTWQFTWVPWNRSLLEYFAECTWSILTFHSSVFVLFSFFLKRDKSLDCSRTRGGDDGTDGVDDSRRRRRPPIGIGRRRRGRRPRHRSARRRTRTWCPTRSPTRRRAPHFHESEFDGFLYFLYFFFGFWFCFTGFCWVELFSRFYIVFSAVLLNFTRLYWGLLGFIGFTGFYWFLPSFNGFYWVLLGFTGFF